MPTVNQEADRIVKGMKKNHHRFKELYGDRDKEVMYATANKLAQKKQVKQKTWKSGDGFKEENKSGDSSLRDWFSKSKSSDGKPGWVQLGGKYAGKPCAKQPGQTTKPKCGSSKMKRNLNKDEEEAAFRRKNAKDPNPDRKGKAINVKTEETINERGDYWHPDPDKDRKLGGPGANQRAREDRAASSKPKSDPKKLRPGESYMEYSKRMKTRKEDCWDGYEKKGMKTMFGKKYPNCVKKTKTKKEEVEHLEEMPYQVMGSPDGKKEKKIGKPVKSKKYADARASELADTHKKTGGKYRSQYVEAAGEKDACYKKVKSRYSVWPSAYASGALVKCRKVGAANWGNKSKKEEFEGNLTFSQFSEKAQSCWKSHKKVGMKMKGGKLVNDCRPKNEEVTNEGAAWTKKSGKSDSGGLNEKGRKSYERENPGSDLKAPSKKVGNPRRASFCARMRGMKKKLTSKKTASDPDSRINKSLRAWNC